MGVQSEESSSLAYAGERLIESVELYIGQQLIDKHYQTLVENVIVNSTTTNPKKLNILK